MPTYVLLVGCNGMLRETADRLFGSTAHRVVSVPDLESATHALSGIQFDVLAIGELPFDAAFARFLGEAKSLQPGLRVVDVKTHAGRAATSLLKQRATPRWLAGGLLTVPSVA